MNNLNDIGSILLDQPPKEVLKQVQTLKKMHGSLEQILEGFEGGNSYRERLIATYQKYKDEGKYDSFRS